MVCKFGVRVDGKGNIIHSESILYIKIKTLIQHETQSFFEMEILEIFILFNLEIKATSGIYFV